MDVHNRVICTHNTNLAADLPPDVIREYRVTEHIGETPIVGQASDTCG